jgi:molybdopterin-synthase adenylyltransferase
MLTLDELERYDRQIMLREIGREGQEKLKKARVFIAGAGGLGSPAAIYLTAAGIGNIRIVDCDTVELSNLNRQVLHWNEDRGRSKAHSASEKLKRLNPDVEIQAIRETITEANLDSLLAGYHLIVDAMDNLPSRYLLNKAALEHNIPFFHGAIYGFEGRAMTIIPPKTACLRCVYRGIPPEETFPVIGTTPALIGCIQATEVIKYILGVGELLTNKLINYDALDMKFTEFTVNKDPHCAHCGQVKGKN